MNRHTDTFTEQENTGNAFREKQLLELTRFIEKQRAEATEKRARFFRPDESSPEKYEISAAQYRQLYRRMLGWPLAGETLPQPEGDSELTRIGEDRYGTIYRSEIPAAPGLSVYGLLFLPREKGPHPLVISQHGGGGTPELCSSFFGPSNYNEMTRRVLERGAAVYSPQLLLWSSGRFGPGYDRKQIDVQLKQLGGSITALEIFKIGRSLDFLCRMEEIDENRIGMIGLSYGGFYTVFTAAADIRIKAAVSSCYVNDRFLYDWPDWTWFNAGNTFLDAEVCALICPRALYLEEGSRDELFHSESFLAEAEKVALRYRKLGLSDRFAAKVFDGGHELCRDTDSIDFLFRYL